MDTFIKIFFQFDLYVGQLIRELDFRLYWAIKMQIFFGCLGRNDKLAQKITIFAPAEGILCTTGSYKLPGLPQRSQI